jgi:nitrogen PTS system EIIA component
MTVEITDLITSSSIVANLRVATKRQALHELARRAAALCGLPEATILDALTAREQLGTTGIGGGTAVPHGRLDGIARPMALFARLEKPIDFEAIDGQAVDLIFLLLTPSESGTAHLTALARLSRFLRDRAVCAKLRGTDDVDALYAILTDRAESHAA